MWSFCELDKSEYFTSTSNILNNFPGESGEKRKENLEDDMYLELFISSKLPRNLWLKSVYHS